jgi:hypothetical protein
MRLQSDTRTCATTDQPLDARLTRRTPRNNLPRGDDRNDKNSRGDSKKNEGCSRVFADVATVARI